MRRVACLVSLFLPALCAADVPDTIGPYRLGQKASGDFVETTFFGCEGEVFAHLTKGKVSDIVFSASECDVALLEAKLGKPQGGGRSVQVWQASGRMLVYEAPEDTGVIHIHLIRRNDAHACLDGDGFAAFEAKLHQALSAADAAR